MQMSPYLSFNGDCEAAFKFYERCLGAQPGAIFRYAGTPVANQVPAGWSDKVMHGSVTLGDQMLMGADMAPDKYEAPKGFSVTVSVDDFAEASLSRMVVGLKVAVESPENPEALKEMVPVKPPTGVAVTV